MALAAGAWGLAGVAVVAGWPDLIGPLFLGGAGALALGGFLADLSSGGGGGSYWGDGDSGGDEDADSGGDGNGGDGGSGDGGGE